MKKKKKEQNRKCILRFKNKDIRLQVAKTVIFQPTIVIPGKLISERKRNTKINNLEQLKFFIGQIFRRFLHAQRKIGKAHNKER